MILFGIGCLVGFVCSLALRRYTAFQRNEAERLYRMGVRTGRIEEAKKLYGRESVRRNPA